MKYVILSILTWLNRVLLALSIFLFFIFISANRCGDDNGEWSDYRDYSLEYYFPAFFFNLSVFLFSSLERRNKRLRYIFLLLAIVLLIGGNYYRFHIPC